jgi:high-affinity Fe2+/Pb2+ permease
MSKNISVKVKVSVLTEALRKALADREARFASNKKLEADYNKAHEKWKADFMKSVIASVKNGKAKPDSVTERNHRWGSNSQDEKTTVVELTLNIPKSILTEQPERPDLYNEWEYKQDKEALENAIRVLEMSDQELVSTGTYHSVVKYL